MRAALTALTDELRRLKTAGVKSVSVTDETLALLRKVVASRQSTGRTAPPLIAATPREGSDTRTPPAAAPVPATQSAPSPRLEPPVVTAQPRAVPPAPVPTPAPASVPLLPPPPVVTLPGGDKDAQLAWLRELVFTNPTCLANIRPGKKVVLGVGDLNAKIMFVGEAPGAEEEIQGEPFVGPAGQLLTRMIQGMGLKREQVYIGNIMNWRPQMPVIGGGDQVGNRPPTPEELAYCLPFLRAQIEIVNPDFLVALGSTAAQGLLGAGSFKALGDIRGLWKQFAGKPVMVTYHPSYILRNNSNRSKRAIWEDLLLVMERAGLPISEKQRGYFLDK